MTQLQKDTIMCQRRDGVGYTEIAKRLGLSVNTVKSFGARHGAASQDDAWPDGWRRCLQCGAVYEQPQGRKTKRFCSDACRLTWWHRHPGMSSRAVQIICPGRHKPFMALPGVKHCSKNAIRKRGLEVGVMTQIERDQQYLVALSIFRNLHQKGVVSESELVRIAAFLAEQFSASGVAKTPELA